MKPSRGPEWRTITGAEVESWFGATSKSRLEVVQYNEIATDLTKMRWPSDEDSLPAPQPTVEPEPDMYWDFDAASDAAKLLLENIPAMLTHWDGLLLSQQTRGGLPAIKALQDVLIIALPYIEWPFGQYERQTGRKEPKTWHSPAVAIARTVITAIVKAGHIEPGITRNSVVARIVKEALVRMGYANAINIGAIGAHLTRWDKRYGLTARGIAALTTK